MAASLFSFATASLASAGAAGVGGAFLLLAMLGLALTVIHIVALVQCATATFADSTNKLVWILLILFLPLLGTILWFAIGTSQTVKYR